MLLTVKILFPLYSSEVSCRRVEIPGAWGKSCAASVVVKVTERQ